MSEGIGDLVGVNAAWLAELQRENERLQAQLAEAGAALIKAPRPTELSIAEDDCFENYKWWWTKTRGRCLKALAGGGGE